MSEKTYTYIEYSVSGSDKKGRIAIDETFLQTRKGHTESDMAMIVSALEFALNSDIFRAMLDEWFAKNNDFTIDCDPVLNHAEPNSGVVQLNMEETERIQYIDINGNVQPSTLAFVLIHELGHALTGRRDNEKNIITNGGLQGEFFTEDAYHIAFVNPENGRGGRPEEKIRGDHTDYKQPNVTFVNTIYKELGIPQLSSYFAQDSTGGSYLTKGDSYTNNAYIDRSIILTSQRPADWDSSTLMDKDGNYSKNNTASDLLIGDGRDNTLKSGGGNDWLYGMGGDDHLYGGSGINYLFGGEGKDTYYIESGGGGDMNIIDDSDNNGVLNIDGREINRLFKDQENSNLYYDDYNFKYVQQGNDVLVFHPGADMESSFPLVIIKNLNLGALGQPGSGNDLGLTIVDDPEIIARRNMKDMSGGNYYVIANSNTSRPDQTIAFKTGDNHDMVAGGSGVEIMELGGGNDQAVGGLGNDIIDGGSGNDVLLGSAFNASEDDADNDHDKIIGGQGNDLIFGGIGNDYIITGTSEFEAGESEGQGDWAVGGTGDDFIFGGKDDDFLGGGAGRDYIYGGGGDDVILGDGNIIFGHGSKTGNVRNASYSWNPVTETWSVLYGQYSPYLDPNSFNWSVVKNNDDLPDFTLTTERPVLTDERQAQGGGRDVIEGGAGDDWIAGQSGGDYIDGGIGDDVIYGSDIDDRGNYEDNSDVGPSDDYDTLIGGAGKDKIYGGSGNDTMYSDEIEYTLQ